MTRFKEQLYHFRYLDVRTCTPTIISQQLHMIENSNPENREYLLMVSHLDIRII